MNSVTDSVSFDFIELYEHYGYILDNNLNTIQNNDRAREKFAQQSFKEIIGKNYTDTLIRDQETNFTINNCDGVDWKIRYNYSSKKFIALGKDAVSVDYKYELEQFLYSISHDLSEPIRTIRAFHTFLKKDIDNMLQDDKILEDLGYMDHGINKLEGRLHGLLRLSRTTRTTLKFERISVHSLVTELLENPFFERVDIIEKDKEVNIFTVKNLFKLSLEELLSNSLKFQSTGNVQVVIEKDRVKVVDQGIGFPMDQLKNIFRPFHQLHPYGQYEGHGMGLAIANKAISIIRMKISVKSSENAGSTFELNWR